MKNRELIAMLQPLPLEADVLVHVPTEDDDDCMGEPRSANAEFDCDDNQVVRLHCDGAFVESQPWPVWATRLEKFMRSRMDLNSDEGVSLDDVTDHIEELEREASSAIEKFEVERKARNDLSVAFEALFAAFDVAARDLEALAPTNDYAAKAARSARVALGLQKAEVPK